MFFFILAASPLRGVRVGSVLQPPAQCIHCSFRVIYQMHVFVIQHVAQWADGCCKVPETLFINCGTISLRKVRAETAEV